ncbi:MAG TPA: GH25 family lysozyme [Marmoricola sp.]
MFNSLHGWSRRALITVPAVMTVLAVTAGAALASTPGIDVARYQHNPSIDWSQVRNAGVRFAFIKATEGAGYVNPYLAADWAGTRQARIYRGAYHFARPSTDSGDAATEARYFVAHAGTMHGAGVLPPVLDLEVTGGLGVSALRAWVSRWLHTVENLTGRAPIIYVSPHFWKTAMGDSTAFHHYPLWIAHYAVSTPTVPGGWPTWTFWQGTSSGRVPGINGNTDLDAFNGSLTRLKVLANVIPGSTPAPTPTALSLTARRPAVRAGAHGRLTGALTRADSDAGLSGRAVRLWVRPARTHTWRLARKAITASGGRFRFVVTPRRSSYYRVRFAGTQHLLRAVSPRVRITTR